MCQLLESIIVGMGTGILSGIITGVIVTKYYRKKDEKRDTEKFTRDLKRHIVSIYRILREVQSSSYIETKIEQIENLRRELLYAPVLDNDRWLSEQDKKILEEYNKDLKNLKSEISEYSRCRDVIYILEKYPDTSEEKQHLSKTKRQYETVVNRLGTYNSIWFVLMNKLE